MNDKIRARCAVPDAPWTKCYLCMKPLKTCERPYDMNGDYICPVHTDGSENSDGYWVCNKCSEQDSDN
jgi:hypothetical protein